MAEQPAHIVFCPNCGYDLTGLAEARCPECGQEFSEAALQQEYARPKTTVGKAVARIMLLPLLATGAGWLTGALAQNRTTEGLGVLLGFGMGALLLLGGVLLSRKLALQLAVHRAERLRLVPFGRRNRAFMWTAGIGLFCCQGFLASGGFFGGCACALLQNANFH